MQHIVCNFRIHSAVFQPQGHIAAALAGSIDLAVRLNIRVPDPADVPAVRCIVVQAKDHRLVALKLADIVAGLGQPRRILHQDHPHIAKLLHPSKGAAKAFQRVERRLPVNAQTHQCGQGADAVIDIVHTAQVDLHRRGAV